MKQGFRQSMAWLHTWSGLLLAWLLFAIFVTGTLAFFRSEITLWMQPETHLSQAGSQQQSLDIALAHLAQVAPQAIRWQIGLPDQRQNTVDVAWRDADSEGGRRRGPRHSLDASTGEPLAPRETLGGSFLYRFHFELYSLPRNWARWIVGIATMAMFVAIISGIITHKKIFADFFTFRRAKGQRSWLDGHAFTAVLALPFHLMITYSGLLLLSGTLLPWNNDGRRHRDPPAAEEVQVASQLPGSHVIMPMLNDARASWGQPVGRVSIEHPGRPEMQIEVAPRRNSRLTAHSGSGSNGVERRLYDATGRLLNSDNGPEVNAIQATYNSFGSLHRGRFAGPTVRWLYFVAGILGTLMVASGLVLWTVKRDKDPAHLGHRLVSGLNVAAIAGLSNAVAAYFWANRLLPVGLAQRAEWEIRAFFLTWLACALHPLARKSRQAWLEQLILAGALFASLPLLNALTSPGHLGSNLSAGRYALVGFDLMALITGLCLIFCADKVHRHQPSPQKRRRSARPAALNGEGVLE